MALPAPPKVFWEDEEYAVRPARDNDECRAEWWAYMQILGWNRGYHDLDTYLNPSLGRSCGMIVLEQKSTGNLIGQVAAIINENSTGWVSMFIVKAEFRGKGLGRHLFDAVLKDFERAGTEIVGLDAVEEQVGTYERRGFVVAGGPIQLMIRDLHQKTPAVGAPEPQGTLIDLRDVPHELLAASDKEYTGFERPDVWSDANLFNRPDVSGHAIVTKSPPQTVSDIIAWVLVRRSSEGFHIGPLYAKNVHSAESALQAAVANAQVKTITEIPLPNEEMNDWSEEKVIEKATWTAEVSTWNPEALAVFERQGWRILEHQYFRMWRHNKATPEHDEGGLGRTGIYGIMDAAIG